MTFDNPLGDVTLIGFLDRLLDLFIYIAFPIIVLFIIWAGFQLVTAGGNEKQLSDAKKMILWTLVGAAIVLGAKVISVAINSTVTDLLR